MLGFLFGFNARLGRLHYFLAGLALAAMTTLVCFALAAYAFQHTPRGATPSANLLLIPVFCVTPVFLWITLSLQAIRIRDIGWKPIIVIPAWLLILAIDGFVAIKFPAWSAGKEHHQTIIGLLTNLGLNRSFVVLAKRPRDWVDADLWGASAKAGRVIRHGTIRACHGIGFYVTNARPDANGIRPARSVTRSVKRKPLRAVVAVAVTEIGAWAKRLAVQRAVQILLAE